MSIWQILGLAPTRDRAAIRRAYADRLKKTHPEDDPDGFRRLREAYEAAIAGCVEEVVSPILPTYAEPANMHIEPERPNPHVEPAHPPEPRAAFRVERIPEAELVPPGREPAPPPEPRKPLERLEQRLLEALEAGDHAGALAALEEIESLPEILEIETKWQFEERLVASLRDRDFTPEAAFIAVMDRMFGWTASRETKPGTKDVIDSWLERRRALEALDALKEEARSGPFRLVLRPRPFAARLLLGPYRRGVMLWAMCHDGTVAAMREIWDELRIYDCPAVLEFLDPKVVEWWRRRVVVEPPFWFNVAQTAVTWVLLVSIVFAAVFGITGMGLVLAGPLDVPSLVREIAFNLLLAITLVPASYVLASVVLVAVLAGAESTAEWLRPRAEWARILALPRAALLGLRRFASYVSGSDQAPKQKKALVDAALLIIIASAIWAMAILLMTWAR